jgi:hypothetical protein
LDGSLSRAAVEHAVWTEMSHLLAITRADRVGFRQSAPNSASARGPLIFGVWLGWARTGSPSRTRVRWTVFRLTPNLAAMSSWVRVRSAQARINAGSWVGGSATSNWLFT